MNTTRSSLLVTGILQLIIGFVCIICGIFERISVNNLAHTKEFHEYLTLTTLFFLGAWAGVLIAITGLLGILTKVKYSFKRMTAAYLGFNVISIILAFIMITCYSISLTVNYSIARYREHLDYVMSIVLLVLGVLEFGIGILASICCCRVLKCSCCDESQTAQVGQVVYMQTQAGGPPAAYIIVQGPDGTPVAVPAQTSGPMTEQSGTPPHYSNTAAQLPQQKKLNVP